MENVKNLKEEKCNFEPEDNFKGVDFGTALMLMKNGEKMMRENGTINSSFIVKDIRRAYLVTRALLKLLAWKKEVLLFAILICRCIMMTVRIVCIIRPMMTFLQRTGAFI